MTDTLRIKRRAAGGAAGPPAALAASELAYNEQDDNLYYGKGNSAGAATSIIPIAGPGFVNKFLPLTGGTLTGNLALSLTNPQTTLSGGSVSAAPAFVNASTFQSTTATSITVTLPTGRVNGNLLIAWAQTGNSAASLTLSGAGWTQASNVVSTGFVVAVAYAYVTGTEVSPVWTLNTADTVKAYVMQYSGAASSAGIGSVSSVASTTAGTTFTATAITTTRNNSVVAAMFYTNGTGALGTPAGYTSRASQTTLGNGVWSDNTYATGGTSTGAISCTGPAASAWNATLIEILAPKTVGINTLLGQIAGSSRWALQLGDGTSEGGSNAGSNLAIQSYTDGGVLLATPLSIARSSGIASFTQSPTAPTPTAADSSTKLATTAFVASAVTTGAIMRSYIAGLTIAPSGGTTFTVSPGLAADSTNSFMMAAATNLKTNGAWAVGSGNGGLDTGTIANTTWYHVYLIRRPDTGIVDVLFSLNATSPFMPPNYSEYRRIGSLLTGGSANFVLYNQLGDDFTWSPPFNDVPSTALVVAPTLKTLTVPTGVQVVASIQGMITGATAASVGILFSSPDTGGLAAGVGAGRHTVYASQSTGGAAAGRDFVRTNTSGQIYVSASATGASYYLNTMGWNDSRGKNN